ncbi:MAG: hypothetical protein PHV33_08645 [Elusimicrobiales bacterium]|nr:hypothetical protein [Elusimicrobiales bacterium]
MGTRFSETLTRLRQEAGFKTPHQFYHANGGNAVLKISYRNYLLMEQGKILPVFSRLEKLCAALRMAPKSAQGGELVLAWLRTMAGDDAFGTLLEPLLSPERAVGAGYSPVHKALARALSGRKYYVTPEQLRVISANRANYLCSLAFFNDTGEWSAEELAKILKLGRPSVAGAIKALLGLKLLKRATNGRYQCPLATDMVEYPPLRSVRPELVAAVRKQQDSMVSCGTPVSIRRGFVRADSTVFKNFIPLLELNISAAQTYAVAERTPNTAVYMVEGRVVKVLDF